jgi:hypothetical protein
MQCAAFLAGALSPGPARRALVVAPKTLLAHWERELAACGLGARTKRFFGSSDGERRGALRALCSARGGVLLTTYGMVQHNPEALARGAGPVAGGARGLGGEGGGRALPCLPFPHSFFVAV